MYYIKKLLKWIITGVLVYPLALVLAYLERKDMHTQNLWWIVLILDVSAILFVIFLEYVYDKKRSVPRNLKTIYKAR